MGLVQWKYLEMSLEREADCLKGVEKGRQYPLLRVEISWFVTQIR